MGWGSGDLWLEERRQAVFATGCVVRLVVRVCGWLVSVSN